MKPMNIRPREIGVIALDQTDFCLPKLVNNLLGRETRRGSQTTVDDGCWYIAIG